MQQTPHRVRIDTVVYQAYLGPSSDCLPSCSLWHWRCSLALDTICLSHSVDSSVLSYTVRSPPSRSIAQNIKHVCKFEIYVYFCSIKIFGIWSHANRQTDRQTHASCNAVTLVWGSLRLAPINDNETLASATT